MIPDAPPPRSPTSLHEEARLAREEARRTMDAAAAVSEHVRRVLRAAGFGDRPACGDPRPAPPRAQAAAAVAAEVAAEITDESSSSPRQ